MESKKTCRTLNSGQKRKTVEDNNTKWPVLYHFQREELQGTQ